MTSGLIEGSFDALEARGINEETCRKFSYKIGKTSRGPCQIADYRDESGAVVAQHLRFAGKEFSWVGEAKQAGLWGRHLWGDGGKRLIITEGEIDAMSMSQVLDNRWPVVSIPNGAQGAAKTIKRELEWLEKYTEVIFLFDGDEPGRAAAQECAQLLTPGRAKIGSLPLKDANEMLKAGRVGELVKAQWDAKAYRPDGIVAGTDLWETVSKEDETMSIAGPWAGLDRVTKGMRRQELWTFTAGSGVGKSAVCRELAHHLMKQGETVGYIALEESTRRTALGLMGIEVNKPLHVSKDGVSEEELKDAFGATVGSGRCYLYDHFGSIDSGNLLARIRYLARGCGCGWIVLDHLSIVVSGIGDGDERRLIDNVMTSLRSLVQETGVGMILVSHLKRPSDSDKGHEDGAKTSLSQLRGSAAIAQLSDMVVGIERDLQSLTMKHVTKVRVLKNRFSGDTGIACLLRYDPKTGRLKEEAVDEEAITADAGDGKSMF